MSSPNAAPALSPEQLAEIAALYEQATSATVTDADLDRMLTHPKLKERLLDHMRDHHQLTYMWGDDTREGTPCRICGALIAKPTRRRGNNSFGKSSHMKGHLNRGEVWNRYGVGTDGYVMPSLDTLRAAVRAIIREREVKPLLKELKAERKALRAQREVFDDQRTKLEADVLKNLRKHGWVDKDAALEIQLLSGQIEEQEAELNAINAKYPEDVVNQLALGDL